MKQIQELLTREHPVRWVLAGDSITHGAAHTEGWRDYTELFSERLRWELGRPRDLVIKTGISGWTVAALLADFEANVLDLAPDCVSLMFGMNDCVQGPNDLPGFRERYRTVVETIRERTGAFVLAHTPNAVTSLVGEPRFSNLAGYCQAILDLCTELDVPCIDHFTFWNSHESSGLLDDWLPDGFHPNEYGHRVLAGLLHQELGIWDSGSPTCRLALTPRGEISIFATAAKG